MPLYSEILVKNTNQLFLDKCSNPKLSMAHLILSVCLSDLRIYQHVQVMKLVGTWKLQTKSSIQRVYLVSLIFGFINK